jgi:uncharacterized protein
MRWSSLRTLPQRPRRFPITRRGFLKLCGAGLASAACLGGYAVGVEPHWIDVVRRRMPLANLPAHWHGRTVAQISDLHVGRQVDSEYLVRAFRQIERMQVDLLLITGDFQTCFAGERVDDVWRVMRRLRPPAGGAYAILGNHDFGRGWDNTLVADATADRLADCGIGVLRNQHCVVDDLAILGVDDLWSPTYNARGALAGVPEGVPTIAMCHNPDGVDGREWQSFRGWVLAGHTHGGQCRPPFLPAPIVPVINKRYVAGSYNVGPGRTLYINRGLGHSWKVRFNARPEITCFTLVPASPPDRRPATTL